MLRLGVVVNVLLVWEIDLGATLKVVSWEQFLLWIVRISYTVVDAADELGVALVATGQLVDGVTRFALDDASLFIRDVC